MYKCKKCGKEFKYQSRYTTHLNRITPCNIKSNSKYKCSICNKIFRRREHLKNHMNRVTKCNYKKNNNKNKEMLLLDKEIEILKLKLALAEKDKLLAQQAQTQTTTNNHSTEPKSNTITELKPLIAFGEEKMEGKIPKNILKNCIHMGAAGDAKLFRYAHFNSEHPEWKNIIVRDVNRRKYLTFTKLDDDGKEVWEKINEDRMINEWIIQANILYTDDYLNLLSEEEKKKLHPSDMAYLRSRKAELTYREHSFREKLVKEMRDMMSSVKESERINAEKELSLVRD